MKGLQELLYRTHGQKQGECGNREGRQGGLGWWGRVGGKAENYLNNNKKYFKN